MSRLYRRGFGGPSRPSTAGPCVGGPPCGMAHSGPVRGVGSRPMNGTRRIGILTGGGDVPGLNSVIKSVVYRATEIGDEVVGIRRGWEGLTHVRIGAELDRNYIRPLDRQNTRTIDRTGG